MGDRQRFDHGILKEGFLGKAKLNKVSQLFSKKGKVSCTNAYLFPPSICDGIVRSTAHAAEELLRKWLWKRWLPLAVLGQSVVAGFYSEVHLQLIALIRAH